MVPWPPSSDVHIWCRGRAPRIVRDVADELVLHCHGAAARPVAAELAAMVPPWCRHGAATEQLLAASAMLPTLDRSAQRELSADSAAPTRWRLLPRAAQLSLTTPVRVWLWRATLEGVRGGVGNAGDTNCCFRPTLAMPHDRRCRWVVMTVTTRAVLAAGQLWQYRAAAVTHHHRTESIMMSTTHSCPAPSFALPLLPGVVGTNTGEYCRIIG